MRDSARAGLSEASLRCRAAIPSLESRSSRDLGWTSLLVDVHEGIAWHEAYDAVATLDPRVGVSLGGRYVSEFHRQGSWRRDPFRTGTTSVLRSEEPRRFRFSPLGTAEPCRFALIYLPLSELELALDHLKRPGVSRAVPWFNQVIQEDPAILHVARALIAAMLAGTDELYAGSVAAWLAMHLLVAPRLQASAEDLRSPGELTDRRLRRVVDFMAAHFAEPLTIDRLASEAGISRFHFARLFHRRLGLPPHRFLSELRLDAARRMLADTDMAIAAIAQACGYAAVPQFSAGFRARFGISPARFRRSCHPD